MKRKRIGNREYGIGDRDPEEEVPPPIKMDYVQNKGVAGRAFCKWLNRKRMDNSK